MNSFRRPIRDVTPAPALNDCDLEARQQQSIIRAGYSNPQKEWGSPWTAIDENGDPYGNGEATRQTVDPNVYRRDDA